ncbi:YraN family protein, partial [Achromobacter xylosoxidans]
MDDTFAFELALAARRRAARRRRRASPRPRGDAPAPRRSPRQRIGDSHEEAALRLLQGAGLVLLARNLACPAGEIDLAMRDGDVLVFVEVRARRSDTYGGAAASIGRDKQARLARAAAHWLPRLARHYWR